MDSNLKELITIGLAAVGAVLGILNTWNSINQRRVRLRVIPAFLLKADGSPAGFSIEAINLSVFPLTLAEVGFRTSDGKRIVISNPSAIDNKPLPRRIEPREAISFMFGPGNFEPPKEHRIGPAYVRTACGRTINGDSPARKQFADLMADRMKGSM